MAQAEEKPVPSEDWFLYPLVPFCAGLAAHAGALVAAGRWIADRGLGAVLAILAGIIAAGAACYVTARRDSDAGILTVCGYMFALCTVAGLAASPPLLVMSALFGGLIWLMVRITKPPQRLALPPVAVMPVGLLVLLAVGRTDISAIAAASSLLLIVLLLVRKHRR